MTPDPYGPSSHPADPQTWNRYQYVHGDPVGRHDPSGLCDVVIAGITENSINGADLQDFANGNGDVSVYPFSANSDNSSALSKIGNALVGIVQVATQAFGPNSSTFTAVAGLVLAAQDGKPINVTAFSGGAGTFTAAVAFLNSQGSAGTAITSMINSITYVAPGSNGPLYNNGNVSYIGGGARNNLVAAASSIPQAPKAPTFYYDRNNCGHNFACLAEEFPDAFNYGDPCSRPTIFDQQDNSRWQRMFIDGYGDPSWWWDLSFQGLLTPSVDSTFHPL